MKTSVPFPVVIAKEGSWFVASCPLLDIATQGRTEQEAKENIADLIKDYLTDPDTPKPSMKSIMSLSLTSVPVELPAGERRAAHTRTA